MRVDGLAQVDQDNSEEQARLRLMDREGHMELSGPYHSWRSSQVLIYIDDQVAQWRMI